ncbi:Phosphotransferase enzyme family protein [Paenibacillus sp. yr247]|uniref:phosphotransferase n=1 Tax=Paenibacillus sp. yr247 TaxID=1761880 RepID=UPI000887F371|nr:phosphotransferase [Paenibacillus sp. yr247]SDN67837.1 Phosphotransferase enzyme family protein [Paenibacillus sp. yr247]
MEVKYRIEDNILLINLNKEYGIQIESIHFIPLGDSAYSYWVNCANGDRYYLKLFDHQNDRQIKSIELLQYYLPLTWQMYHQGLFRNITYPIKNQNGLFQTTFNDITTVLFNFIEGETLAEAYPFSKEILEDIAKSVATIQRITPFIDNTMLLVDTFDISFDADLKKCNSVLESTVTFENNIKQALREHILPKKEEILDLLNLLRKLRSVAITNKKEMVLCHGDIWGGNLIRHENELYFIDWESAIIAPPEFDLVGYIGEEFDVFFSSYEKHLGRSVTVNLELFRFYSYRHHLRNLTNWLMNILYRNTEEAQNENDLEMILCHCMNRWDSIEPKVRTVDAILQSRK